MTVVFAVLAHDDPAMLRRLVDALSPYRVVVHLDKRVDLDAFDSVANLASTSNASYSASRVAVSWGGYSVVEAMLSAGLDATEGLENDDHVAFLSGRCYPVRPPADFEQFVSASNTRQHVRYYRLAEAGKWHANRIRRRHWFDFSYLGLRPFLPRQIIRLLRACLARTDYLRPPVQTALDVVAGSQWMALTAECLQDAAAALTQHEYSVFKNAFAPDEMAIQTFVFNSKWRVQSTKGEAEPMQDKISSIANYHLLDSEMIGSITSDPLALPESSRPYFARKFSSSDVSQLDAIDMALSHDPCANPASTEREPN
jgi:hypothetical protein